MSFNPDLTLNAIVVNLIATHDGRVPLTQGALAHAAFLRPGGRRRPRPGRPPARQRRPPAVHDLAAARSA